MAIKIQSSMDGDSWVDGIIAFANHYRYVETNEDEITFSSTPPGCAHEWKSIPGIFKVYEDCTKCGRKREECSDQAI